jgi:hypothetical protein
MFLAGGEEDLRPLAAKIDAEVRKQYLLGFTPSGRGEVKYRVLVVSVTKPGSGTCGRGAAIGEPPRSAPETTFLREGVMGNRRWSQWTAMAERSF